ncbi:hypothetical protein [Listeria innocua]|uniref:hypothetical protein n=1 Tax=Listeria innocua TaxID=1642 RepID=UPI0021AB912C|nr:hypothetical protein [Listeria innocua]
MKDLFSNIEKGKDKAKSDNATKAAEEASGAKLINSADDVVYNGKSVDKAFGKHGKDFGSYPDGSSSSVKLFEQDVKELIQVFKKVEHGMESKELIFIILLLNNGHLLMKTELLILHLN